MTLKELNDKLCGFPERCFMIFKSVDDMDNSRNRIGEIWTPYSNGRGGVIDKWSDRSIINKEVVTFQAAGWQSNIYYVVLK